MTIEMERDMTIDRKEEQRLDRLYSPKCRGCGQKAIYRRVAGQLTKNTVVPNLCAECAKT